MEETRNYDIQASFHERVIEIEKALDFVAVSTTPDLKQRIILLKRLYVLLWRKFDNDAKAKYEKLYNELINEYTKRIMGQVHTKIISKADEFEREIGEWIEKNLKKEDITY